MKILFDDFVCEEVEVTEVSPGVVRLDDTPTCSSSDLYFGDVIEVEQDLESVWKYVGLRSRSELEHMSALVGIAHSTELGDVLAAIEELGVHWEQAFGGMFFFHGSREQLAAARSLLSPLVAGV